MVHLFVVWLAKIHFSGWQTLCFAYAIIFVARMVKNNPNS
jgi:hypothetical protein